jgi:hypothetical protein
VSIRGSLAIGSSIKSCQENKKCEDINEEPGLSREEPGSSEYLRTGVFE